MGARKLLVYGGRRWRELELRSGRVAGWADVQFVCVRRGKLLLQPRARVLRALRALGAGERSAAKDGPRLSQIRLLEHERQSMGRRVRDVDSYRKDHTTHMCHQRHDLRCSTDANFNSIQKPPTISVAVQCSEQVTTGVQADPISSSETSVELHTNNKTQRKHNVEESERLKNKDHGSEQSKTKDHGSERLKNKDHGSEQSKTKDHGSERLKNKDHGSEQSKTKDHGSERLKNKDHGSEQSKTKDHGSEQSKTKDHGSEKSKTKDHGSEKSKTKGHKRDRIMSKLLLDRKKKTQESTSSDICAVDDYDAEMKNSLQRKIGPHNVPKKAIDKETKRNQAPLSLSSDTEIEMRRKNKLHRQKALRSELAEDTDKEKQTPVSLSSESEFETRKKNNLQGKKTLRSEHIEVISKEKRRNQAPESLGSDTEFETRKKNNFQRYKTLKSELEVISKEKKRNQTPESLGSDTEFETRKKNNFQRYKTFKSEHIEVISKEKRRNKTPEPLSSDTEFETRRKNKLQGKKDHRSGLTQEEQQCKELIVTEEDVLLLRDFLLHDDADVFGVDLLRFDADDRYKESFFYRLNPLVNLERCPRIGRMLRERTSQADSVSLKDFITTLGLRSVTDAGAGPTRYRMRARRSGDAARARRSAADVDKENIAAGHGARNAQVDGILGEKNTNKKLHNRASYQQAKPGTKDATGNAARPAEGVTGDRGVTSDREVTSDRGVAGDKAMTSDRGVTGDKAVTSDRGVGEEQRGKKRRDASATNAAKGGRSGAREYTAAEDAYIVRWVRGDGRANMVNGNRLWVQLQPFHKANTGRSRTWQSLRNHYLRHLLPTLGTRPLPPHEAARLRAAAATARSWQSLRNHYLRHLLPTLGTRPLPPHEAARLRAAAATGELKARKQPPRRNSVFQQPRVRSAWGRRPRPAAAGDGADSKPTSPTRALRSNTAARPDAVCTPPPNTGSLFTSTPTYSELTKRFALEHRSTPASGTGSPTDAPDTSSVTSATTVSADRRTVHTRRSNKRRSSSDSDSRLPAKRRRFSRHRDKSAQDVRRIDLNVERSKQRSKSSDSDTDSPKPNKRLNSVRKRSRSNVRPLADAAEPDTRRRTRSQDSDTTDGQPSNKRHTSARDADNTHRRIKQTDTRTSTSSSTSAAEAQLSTRSGRSATSKRVVKSAVRRDRRPERSNHDSRDRHHDNTDRHSDPRNGDRNGLIRSSQKGDQRNRLRERNAQDIDKSNPRDRSGRGDKRELQSNRQKPRTRRLYNPNAI